MSDSYVDLLYRGLPLGNLVKLSDVRSVSGFLHHAAPMPVGTTVSVVTAEGVSFDATVIEVRERSGPGMVVRPALDAAAQAWWETRVASPAVPQNQAAAAAAGVVRSKRSAKAAGELVDDGRVTEVKGAVTPSRDRPAPKGRAGTKRKRKRR